MSKEDLEVIRLIMTGERAATYNEKILARAVASLVQEVAMLRKRVAVSVKWETTDL